MKRLLTDRRWLWMGVLGGALLAGLVVRGWLRPQDATWARLQGGGALRVALDPSFPPFESLDAQGQVQGFDVDLARALAQRLGVPVTFRAIAFDGLVDAVLADKADVVISAFPLDPRLSQDVHYSPPYFEAGLIWVTRSDSGIASPAAFAGLRVAVEWGSEGDAWARAQGLTIDRHESAGAALQAVAVGEADVALVDAVTAALDAPKHLRLHSPPLVSEPYVMVVSPAAPKLAQMVDETLLALRTVGVWEQLTQRYFPTQPPRPELPD
ncbi:MAG: amino acid ABC transporter substrate-binding protein [Chloroflexi bacterium]|nr:amino acid ABC transporter substrate-binding protein [Chloroflexota bacterium]